MSLASHPRGEIHAEKGPRNGSVGSNGGLPTQFWRFRFRSVFVTIPRSYQGRFSPLTPFVQDTWLIQVCKSFPFGPAQRSVSFSTSLGNCTAKIRTGFRRYAKIRPNWLDSRSILFTTTRCSKHSSRGGVRRWSAELLRSSIRHTIDTTMRNVDSSVFSSLRMTRKLRRSCSMRQNSGSVNKA